MRVPVILVGALVVAAAPATASAPGKRTPLLGPADLDPARVLPPPPVADSAEARAELAELHAIEMTRTDAETAAAATDGDTKDGTIFAEALGPQYDVARLPQTRALLDIVRYTEKAVVDRGKDEFKRPRPWIVDGGLKSCKRGDEPLSSYPSGHTTMAFSMAAVLARLVPARSQALFARAARYGQSRIVCEQHFRSDVTAGQALGMLVAERLAAKPTFAAAFDRAHRELEAAGLTRS
jgi:acid phosphatase (class A)